MRRQIYGKKRQDCNQSCSQQRHGCSRNSSQYCISFTHSFLHIYQSRIVYHNGIVYQHSHSYNNRSQRHTLQGYPRSIHINKCSKNREDQSAPYQKSVFKADKEQQYRDNRQHRNNQVHYKAIVCHSRLISLIID